MEEEKRKKGHGFKFLTEISNKTNKLRFVDQMKNNIFVEIKKER